uniref:PPPDE domain-containing protein n=1 Tax=Macrostomum lignano TaxID=282301 RepID=A0A1I8JMW6_9PLAT
MSGADESNELVITPLGSRPRGRPVLHHAEIQRQTGGAGLAGIHPGLRSNESLPFIDNIEHEKVDVLLAIYRWLLCDFVKVSNNSSEAALYADQDIQSSMERIETIDFHQELEVNGIKFTAYHAGHVLGAAMFLIEIAGVRILYTGDFSRQEDRHLMSAELPPCRPDVLITESTYGTHIHDRREEREARFVGLVHDIVARRRSVPDTGVRSGPSPGAHAHPRRILEPAPRAAPHPIYYASQLAKKCMAVYQTYISRYERISHISNLRNVDIYVDSGPCVIMASPGMMQNGPVSRTIRELCTDKRNGVIIAGYCVEGTLAKQILSHPQEVTTMSGQTLPLKCSVDYVSFSAHTDYQQTSEFIRDLRPAHIVLVHGEQNEMLRLRSALLRQYEDEPDYRLDIFTPKNCESVSLHFRGEKTAKVPLLRASLCPGILMKKNFSYHLVHETDLPTYTDLATSEVTQRMAVHFSMPPSLLYFHLAVVAGSVETVRQKGDCHVYRVFQCVTVTWEPRQVLIEVGQSNPVSDMFADAVQTVILKAELEGMPWQSVPAPARQDSTAFRTALLETLSEMFGPDSVQGRPDPRKSGLTFQLVVRNRQVEVDTGRLTATCEEDAPLQQLVRTVINRLRQVLMPPLLEKLKKLGSRDGAEGTSMTFDINEPVIVNVYDMVYNREYTYGGAPVGKPPAYSPSRRRTPKSLARNFKLKTSIPLGCTHLSQEEIDEVMVNLGQKFTGKDYHLTRQNCNHFSNNMLAIICNSSLPKWVNRLGHGQHYCVPFIERAIPRSGCDRRTAPSSM